MVLLQEEHSIFLCKKVTRDITLQRLKNEAEFCPDSEDNPRCLTEDELKFHEVLLPV